MKISSHIKSKKMSKRAEGPGWLMTTEDREKANVETVNRGKRAAELPIIMMGKWLEQHLPGPLECNCKPIRKGKFFALVKNEATANRAINNATSFYGECVIQIKKMENMNSTQGTIFGRSLLTESIKQIQEALNNYKVTKVERMETMKDEIRSPNGLHEITFNTNALPESVLCGYERFSVKQYYPNP
jgi:hypothetical protein